MKKAPPNLPAAGVSGEQPLFVDPPPCGNIGVANWMVQCELNVLNRAVRKYSWMKYADARGIPAADRRSAVSADALLTQLDRVKRTGPGKWMASSPTREDRSPSLAIRELDDGTVLIHDFGGDSVEDILGAVGLTFSDLYPVKTPSGRNPIRRPFADADVRQLVAFEATVVAIIVNDTLLGKEVSEADYDRLIEAGRRLADVAEVCNARR